MPDLHLTVVDSYQLHDHAAADLRAGGVWDIAVGQRAFGAGQLLVVTADRDGLGRFVAHCDQTDPPTGGFLCCINHLRERHGDEGCAVTALSDEPVKATPPSEEHRDRWGVATGLAEEHGYHLLDWICCGGGLYRSLKVSLGLAEEEDDWWDLP